MKRDLPYQKGISWESHLFGALVGIIVAYWYKNIRESDEQKKSPWDDEISEKQYFLPRDTFDKTLRQREIEKQTGDSSDYWTKNIS